jgi:hypothetical protein
MIEHSITQALQGLGRCGDIGLRIDQHGQWWYQHSLIQRPALVSLFASVLHCEAGQHYLTTPAESVPVEVDDCAFIVIDYRWTADQPPRLEWQTNIGQWVLTQTEQQLKLRPPRTQTSPPHPAAALPAPLPYLQLERGLEARLHRNLYYALLNEAQLETQPDGSIDAVIYSAGIRLCLARERV